MDWVSYQGLEPDAKVELIRGLNPLGLMQEQEEARSLAGARYARGEGYARIRHGSNPGSLRLGGQRVPIRLLQVRGEEVRDRAACHAALQGAGEGDEVLPRRVLYGIPNRPCERSSGQ